MLKLKLQYFGHLMRRVDSLEKTLMLGGIEGRRRRRRQRMRWLDGITDSMDMLGGSQAPRRAVCGTRGSLRTMHGGGSAPSCCAFTHRVAFEEGPGPRVLLSKTFRVHRGAFSITVHV